MLCFVWLTFVGGVILRRFITYSNLILSCGLDMISDIVTFVFKTALECQFAPTVTLPKTFGDRDLDHRRSFLASLHDVGFFTYVDDAKDGYQ